MNVYNNVILQNEWVMVESPTLGVSRRGKDVLAVDDPAGGLSRASLRTRSVSIVFRDSTSSLQNHSWKLPMKYRKQDAKEYARTHMKGIWAAALMPFAHDLAINETGFRKNLRHWIDDLSIDGIFISGKQGEFFSMSLAERKRSFEIAIDEVGDRAGIIASCSDQNLSTVIELAKHAQAIGIPYVVVHAPVLHFLTGRDETLLRYYEAICDQVEIGIAMWSHEDSGYLMSPELCAHIAELPNIVAIKYSVPREMYVRLTRLVGQKIQVSTASEAEWLDNILELDWRLYLCSSPPYLYQTKTDRRMREYTDLAFAGDAAGARRVRDTLNPVREAFKSTRPAEKPQSHSKFWQELLGQVGGSVRPPMLELTDEQRNATRRAFEQCGLELPAANFASTAA
jgi:4-hydroxy-tetrahydrodipicolinate synthase